MVYYKFLKELYLDLDCFVVDEFFIFFGVSRVDIVVINGVIYGYEFKSEYDFLECLFF